MHRLRYENVLPRSTMLSFWKSVAGQGAPDGDRGRHRLTVVTGEVSDALATHLPHHSLTVDTVEATHLTLYCAYPCGKVGGEEGSRW